MKGALEMSRLSGGGVLQPFFSGLEGYRWVACGDRPVSLEQVCHLSWFCIEMLSFLGLLRQGDVMFSIYLKDSYFQIPIH